MGNHARRKLFIMSNEKSYCNKNFLIRVYDYNTKKSTIIRYNGLVAKVGLARAKLAIRDAMNCKTSKCTFKSRKGFRIDFYAI